MRKKGLAVLAAAGALAFGVVACGDDDEDTASGSGTTDCATFRICSRHGVYAHSTMSIARTLPRFPPSSFGMLIW